MIHDAAKSIGNRDYQRRVFGLEMSMSQLIRHTNVVIQRSGILRRDFLRSVAASSTFGACHWSNTIAAQSAQIRRRGKACIVLWMQGGPSQFETFSPLSNHQNGGETRTTETRITGLHISEQLPHIANVMDNICVLRSMTSTEGSHPRASYLWHTGYLPTANVRHPAFGSLAVDQIGAAAADLPSFVRIGDRFTNASDGGLLGVGVDPFLYRDPNGPPRNSQPATERRQFQRRLALLRRVEEGFNQFGEREKTNHQQLYEKAARLVQSPKQPVFDIENEPRQIRQAYGESDFAAGCLMARRLVEQGVTFVEVMLDGWDTHRDNFAQTKQLCQQLDQPYAQLIRDLKLRGMLDDTLVVWMGEFGRTPQINGRGGRDHYPRAFNVTLAGCGVQGGQIIGATDRTGSEVTDRPIQVTDFFHTICHALGMDAEQENLGPSQRPIRVVAEGNVIHEVFG